MINSVNTLEFLKPKLIAMDKFNTATTTRILPPPTSLGQTTRTFVTFTHHAIDPQQQQQMLLAEEVQQQQQPTRQERVKVQHLENHTKLQNNNCWNNFRTLYQLSASSGGGGGSRDKEEMERNSTTKIRENLNPTTTTADKDNDVEVDVEHFTTTNLQQNKSAFNLDFIKNNNSIYGNINKKSSYETNNNINNFYSNQFMNNGLKQLIPRQQMLVVPTLPMTQTTSQRTEDQDHAYRHLESVHNYAKLKTYGDDLDDQSPNDSRHSSCLDDEDDDEEDEEDEDNDEDYDDRLDPAMANTLDTDYDYIYNRRLQKLYTSSDGALTSKLVGGGSGLRKSVQFMNALKIQKKITNVKETDYDDDLHIDVDVETVEGQTISPSSINTIAVNNYAMESSSVKPDHHARRPMNAFLIFCKRHRAIVKERYKNLENRAITKILGDWWASLETNDKKCFTSLAQQNKDAFFSANPNFKWYKLPAPPLRTLTTRPVQGPPDGTEYIDNEATNATMEIISNNTRSSCGNNNNNSNYFKLADEAQMGDLSQLMQDKSKTQQKHCAALQQALGETSQFMSAHITGIAEAANVLEDKQLKRRFFSENSFSSNSSEEDALQPKKKNARTCKGKRYQELINSGQIVTAVKKSSKSSSRLAVAGGGDNNMDVDVKPNFTNLNNNIICQKRSVSESENNILSYDLSQFDLEERIKDLPALDLDDYLQRKRNTKKKKKFTSNVGKKRGNRGSNSNNNNNTSSQTATNPGQQIKSGFLINRQSLQQLQQANQLQRHAAAAAVGSQKRKARKESITRRDVSAIEQEVASLLPLTINGCCYFQEAPQKNLSPTSAITYIKPMEKDIQTNTTCCNNSETATTTLNLTSPIIPLQNLASPSSSSSSSSSSGTVDDNILNNTDNNNTNLNDNISSSTSDLLILAEVAANRTELKH